MNKPSMLEMCLREIHSRCDDVISFQRNRLISDALIKFVEQIYQTNSWFENSPLSVDKQHIINGNSHREIRQYAMGSYSDVQFHLGIIPLALKQKDAEKNMNAIIINYHSPISTKIDETDDEETIAQKKPFRDLSQILLFETGIIHLDYINSETNARAGYVWAPNSHVKRWGARYPENKTNLNYLPRQLKANNKGLETGRTRNTHELVWLAALAYITAEGYSTGKVVRVNFKGK
ncbi:hypothetical protein HN695_02755 [Candidatus Woesearchaeota archaeon]|jgi:hypothetical protein|nr:hypothetical protein [Candidatus Woesearchaeota archaeon]MBT5272111.1 hypothetical protein [Candidatus Woesearchaeota archaeon]MBT6040914.1 hypothetical protein [Candidatus Woesearchaeota archaeon]MBT6336248.1 hypothetical protein [Candidatus Woesearchaeota archaeon]MBT7927231.1 hypothetical protein [Candidatus Woesearchaeota archaeon]